MLDRKVVPMYQNKKLEAALAYAAIGWKILPCWWAVGTGCSCGKEDCQNPGKHPLAKLVPKGQDNATDDPATIKEWWAKYPEANLAANLSGSNLVGIDLDPRNGGLQTMEDLEAKHGPLFSDLLQFTGGGGEHRIFSLPSNMQMPGTLGKGIDVKANGYIMLEPSNHVSGREYAWEASSDPRDGVIASPLPDWLRDHARTPFASAAPHAPSTRLVDQKQIDDLRDALSTQPADDYQTWVNYGNALCELGQAGFTLWDEWSQKSKKYDATQSIRKWRSFKSGSYQLESIFFTAQNEGWINPGSVSEPVPVDVKSVQIAEPPVQADIPADLLMPPGMLGEITRWIDKNANKPVPVFAVHTALAFGSLVLGRRFKTIYNNWSALYFLAIGLSSGGKENAKASIEALCNGCGIGGQVAGDFYTSASGVLSALIAKPAHITVADEFGKVLEQLSTKGGTTAMGTMKTIIEAWGRCDGIMRPQSYSQFLMKAHEKKEADDRVIHNPSLTLYGMTTPDVFFDTIGSSAAKDGTLNRFLIVQSKMARQNIKLKRREPVPENIKQWVKELHTMSAGLVDPATNSALAPLPIEVGIGPEVMELFHEFDNECLALMDKYEELHEMFGRCCEMSLRLALIIAAGRSTTLPMSITGPDYVWARNYVRHHAIATVEELMGSVSDSDFEAAKKQVLNLIYKAGAAGRTTPELNRSSRRFRGMDKRQQINVLESMKHVGEVELVEIPQPDGAQPRKAWVAVQQVK